MTKYDFLDKVEHLIDSPKNTYTIEQLIEFLGSDSSMMLLFLSTFITSIPSPPWGFGFSTVPGGIISLIIAITGFFGLKVPTLLDYLPSAVKNTRLDVHFLKQEKIRVRYYIGKIRKFFKKRYNYMFNLIVEKVVYLLTIASATLMLIPIILTNWFPSMNITFMSLSWLINDGLIMLLSLIFSGLTLTGYGFLTFFGYKAIKSAFT